MKFETNLKDEEEQLIEEYYNIKKQLNELVRKEEFLKNKIKMLMELHNFKNINTDKIDLILTKLERVYYPRQDIEKNVSLEILDKIRKIKDVTVLVSKIKNGNY